MCKLDLKKGSRHRSRFLRAPATHAISLAHTPRGPRARSRLAFSSPCNYCYIGRLLQLCSQFYFIVFVIYCCFCYRVITMAQMLCLNCREPCEGRRTYTWSSREEHHIDTAQIVIEELIARQVIFNI